MIKNKFVNSQLLIHTIIIFSFCAWINIVRSSNKLKHFSLGKEAPINISFDYPLEWGVQINNDSYVIHVVDPNRPNPCGWRVLLPGADILGSQGWINCDNRSSFQISATIIDRQSEWASNRTLDAMRASSFSSSQSQTLGGYPTKKLIFKFGGVSSPVIIREIIFFQSGNRGYTFETIIKDSEEMTGKFYTDILKLISSVEIVP
ncbi:MAG: hypothetical protein OEZ02_01600 [Anaerolineae bacterium]|nr:hypothetical protein [Anaerolineae bacterium]